MTVKPYIILEKISISNKPSFEWVNDSLERGVMAAENSTSFTASNYSIIV